MKKEKLLIKMENAVNNPGQKIREGEFTRLFTSYEQSANRREEAREAMNEAIAQYRSLDRQTNVLGAELIARYPDAMGQK